jgi:hypothetical protein
MDRTAGADPGVVPGLHGRLLGADADLVCGRAAGANPAQGQAGRRLEADRFQCVDGMESML